MRQDSIGFRKDNCVECSLFVISVYASTDGNADTQKEELYEEIICIRSLFTWTLSHFLDLQITKIGFSSFSQTIVYSCLVQISDTVERYTATWYFKPTGTLRRISHVAVSYRWHGSA